MGGERTNVNVLPQFLQSPSASRMWISGAAISSGVIGIGGSFGCISTKRRPVRLEHVGRWSTDPRTSRALHSGQGVGWVLAVLIGDRP